jgi:hypothetical protein
MGIFEKYVFLHIYIDLKFFISTLFSIVMSPGGPYRRLYVLLCAFGHDNTFWCEKTRIDARKYDFNGEPSNAIP